MRDVDLRKNNFFDDILGSQYFLETYHASLNIKDSKMYNPGHNILELYDILVQIRFTTSKKKLGI